MGPLWAPLLKAISHVPRAVTINEISTLLVDTVSYVRQPFIVRGLVP